MGQSESCPPLGREDIGWRWRCPSGVVKEEAIEDRGKEINK
jgi:hypothetical protein